MTDQHSPHVLGCYGDRTVRTPNLDRLATEGTRFSNAYCASPLCVPSRMSFMTARYPHRNRVWNNGHILSSSVPTWAHVLGAAGYETCLVGRMHFVGSDQRHGFEKRPIGDYSGVPPGVPRKGGPGWTDDLKGTSGQTRRAVEVAGSGTTSYQWYDDQVADEFGRFIRRKAASADNRPFAAVCGLLLPHCPFVAPTDLFDYYYDRVDIPDVESNQPETIRRFRSDRDILDPPLDIERTRVARAAYYGMVEYMDRVVGRILDELEKAGYGDDTVVIYCSDHGESAGEHGCWWKSNYYESSVGVPLIVRAPGTTSHGIVSHEVCNLIDIGPTLCDYAGTRFSPAVDGRSLRPVLDDRPSENRSFTFSELVDSRTKGTTPLPSRMIRDKRWKLWYFGDDAGLPPVLFDLEKDPDEVDDLGDSPEHSGIRDELLSRLLDGWNPKDVLADSVEKTEEHATIAAWGEQVLPPAPDAFPQPDARRLETDLRLR